MFLFGYILIGLILGPSFLKFPLPEEIFNLAASGFLLVAGLELNMARLREGLGTSMKVALGAFAIPFAVGFAYAITGLGRDAEGATVIAVALAISALPIVVQVLKELKMYATPLGHTIIAAATICDVAAWIIFSIMLPAGERGRWVASHLPVVFFFVGLMLSPLLARREPLLAWILRLNTWIFAPLFFIGVGMKIHWQESFDPVQSAVVFLVASLAKVAGVYLSARWIHLPQRDAKILAVVLNARGAMEILFCAIALKLGLIDGRLFTSLTVMAVVSSLIAGPLVKLVKKSSR